MLTAKPALPLSSDCGLCLAMSDKFLLETLPEVAIGDD